MKRQPLVWVKIITNETADKELISKIYKQLIQVNTRKINNSIKKRGTKKKKKNLDIYPKKIYRWLKSCSTLLIIREMQIKTTMISSPHTSQNGCHQNLQAINAGEGVENRDHSCTVGGNVN